MMQSHTVDQLLELVGRGRVDISCATDIARAVLRDGLKHETVTKMAALGNFGDSQPNAERDLHTWLDVFGLHIEPYTIHINLKAMMIWYIRVGSSKNHFVETSKKDMVETSKSIILEPIETYRVSLKVNGLREVRMPIGVLLPHEVLHALSGCNSLAFHSIFFGNLPPKDVRLFWDHVRRLEPWKNHPVLNDPNFSYEKLIALQFHADGADIIEMMKFLYSHGRVSSHQLD